MIITGLILLLIATRFIPMLILKGYMWRWHLIPRNKLFNIYLHVFIGDDDTTYHDHPWNSWSLCLWGRMTEYEQGLNDMTTISTDIGPLSFVRRGLKHRHYILLKSRFAVTIFCTGPVKTDRGIWYFYPTVSQRVAFWDQPQSFIARRWNWKTLKHTSE